jgi:uncharacterized protein with HEPN domain
MLDAAREAAQMAQGKTRADLDTDRPLNLSLVRLLEIVGEAASRVPVSERAQYSGIPWVQIIGLRNRLIPRLRQRGLLHSLGNRHPRSATADC